MKFESFLKTRLCEATHGVFSPIKKNTNIIFSGIEYTIEANDFVEDIASEAEEASREGYEKAILNKRVEKSGYLLKLLPVKGDDKKVGIYYAKRPRNSPIRPKEIGSDGWSVSAENADLKPEKFNIVINKWYSIQALYELLQAEIPKRNDLDEGFRDYLLALIEYFVFSGTKTKEELAEFKKIKIPTAQVQKNFGEIIGPFFVTNKKFGILKELGFSEDTAEVSFPKGSEPLIDYTIRLKNDDGSEELFSAKSGTSSNTIKAGDLIHYAGKMGNPDEKDLVEEYKVLKMLETHTAANGPIYAANAIGIQGVDDKFVGEWLKQSLNSFTYVSEFDSFVRANGVAIKNTLDIAIQRAEKDKSNPEYLRYLTTMNVHQPSYGLIRYTIESLLVQMSKKETQGIKLNFSKFFEYVAESVNYIHLSKIVDGVPQFKHIEAEPNSDKIVLKNKNSILRQSDKLGIIPV